MLIKVWRGFTKRKNSTRKPSTSGTDINVQLKDNTSVEAPTFLLEGVDTEINYIQAFGHYYYVNDITILSRDIMQISCTQDVLASHRTAIFNTNAYIERCANTQFVDKGIIDTAATENGDVSIAEATATGTLPFVTDNSGYYATVVNSKITAPWALTAMEFYNLSRHLQEHYSDALQPIGETPAGVIKSIKYMPFTATGTGAALFTINDVDIYETGGQTKAYINSRYQEGSLSLAIARPSDTYGTYLSKPPFTTATLYLPFVGITQFPIEQFFDATSCNIDWAIDQFTGDIVYKIKKALGATSVTIATYSGNCASTDILTSSYRDTTPAVVQTLAGLASFAVNPALGAVSSASAVINGLHNNHAQASTIGGSISSCVSVKLGTQPKLTVTTYRVAYKDEYKDVYGLPCCKTMSIGSFSGYIRCAGASVNMDGFDKDRDEINRYLNSGVFIE